MAKRTKFTVFYGDEIARFSNLRDAHTFAREVSRRGLMYVEIANASGLVAQFFEGEMTPEFAGREVA